MHYVLCFDTLTYKNVSWHVVYCKCETVSVYTILNLQLLKAECFLTNIYSPLQRPVADINNDVKTCTKRLTHISARINTILITLLSADCFWAKGNHKPAEVFKALPYNYVSNVIKILKVDFLSALLVYNGVWQIVKDVSPSGNLEGFYCWSA